ncbi:hypothetical protein HZC34_00245 [Candidatus Saganbacteria bacterium]|nr:hypothetical protein [Candidatus Saganbacteria bacterium]
MLVFPYTTGFAVLLTTISLLFGFLLLLYFFLNKKSDRIAVFSKNPIASFSLISIFACYLVLALGRASLEPEAFLNWGRYHYIPMFFLTILLGAIFPKILDIFGKIFDRGRLRVFFVIIFIFFLMTQFVLLRQKAQSPVRTEGRINSSLLSFS